MNQCLLSARCTAQTIGSSTQSLPALREPIGDGVIGIYLYGSAVSGGLRPLSDLDVLVVVVRPTTAHQRREFVAELLPVSGRQATRIVGRAVEVTVVRLDRVRPWRALAEREFQYGE